MSRPRRKHTHRKGYRSHDFAPAEDARILELRAEGFTHMRVAKAIRLPLYIVTARITRLETLAKIPGAKLRLCIRPECNNEFVSREVSHRVCGICKHIEGVVTEPFGNFVVVMA